MIVHNGRSFKHMCRLPGVVQHLTQLHEWGVLEMFWPHLLDRLVPAAIKDCRLSITSSSDGGGDGGELTPGKPEYWSLLESLLSDCTLNDKHAAQIIKYVIFLESSPGSSSMRYVFLHLS